MAPVLLHIGFDQPSLSHISRNYALENAMEAANVPLMDLMDRWGLANAERMMVKPEQLQLVNMISRKGNSGEVWRGSLWGKAVAIKLLPLVGVDERQLDCLRREVAVLLHTTGECKQCKQVCIYKGFCVKGGNFAIIMKLYSYSLAARVARHPGRRLPLPLALKYSSDIAKGLVELHRLGVTAADLKPDNVLIDDELGDAVIADFGISSVVTCSIAAGSAVAQQQRGARRGGGGATRSSGVLRGTPNYMAPEQFTPGHRPTNKVDIWGWAATLLHMLTGAPPWAADGLLQICTAVGVAKQAPPLPQGLPGQLEGLLRGCFEADPARRPTAGAILKALQAMGPVLERPQLMRATSSLARNSQLLAAARGVLVGLQQDCCQLVQQLQEAEDDGGSSSSSSGLGRLHAVAEDEEDEQQQQQQQQRQLDEQGHGKQRHAGAAGGKNDKQGQQQQQQPADAAASSSRSNSPGKQQASCTSIKSRLGQGPDSISAGLTGAAAAAAPGSGSSSSSSAAGAGSSSSSSSSRSGGSGSHSQLLAEANQLEGLARQLSLSGRRDEAEAALRSALAILSQHLGSSHPNTIAAMTRFALCLNKNNKASEAEGLFRQVLSHRQALLGRRHPQVAAAAVNLAACLYGQGSCAGAAKMYGAALEVRRATLGEQHADTAACMHNLALCKSRLGQFTEAEPLYEQALSIRSSTLGEAHPDVATTAHQLGHCLSQQGRHAEALVFYKQGLWVRRQQQQSSAGGSSSGGGSRSQEDLVASHWGVALCLAQLGCDAQAEEHLSHVLESRTADVLVLAPPPPPGQDVPVTAAAGTAGRHSRQASFAATGVFGSVGLAAGGLDDGVDWSVLEDGDSRLTKQQQDALLAMAAAAEELGRCYSRQGKHGAAEELYWQALEARSQVLGARHEIVQATEEQLRECLDRQC
ncbi:hypothetical protein OEZ85_000642 [Tetradesmus obliquus]|uniref:Protein kinase domain-containing protein n=1 Tax=Tetradesmus obliquus TaxID=3088 RepID=A0ABY8UL71_TETOB|nr:hypothetical protein OEZ85_000642 [Tetradesmus obliquus]